LTCAENAVNADEIIIPLCAKNQVALLEDRLPRASEWQIKCERMYIGRIDNAKCSLIDLGEEDPPKPLQKCEIRTALMLLSQSEQIALCRARVLSFWRRNREFCGACGHKLTNLTEECARKCSECGAVFYPQISPAVIVAITDAEGRLLLAHNRKFKAGVYSLIAGFVEPGESMESAVRREIREEVGCEVENIRYVESQSWPFPDALMVGFTAEYAGGEICPDGAEIADVRFCTPDDLPEIPAFGSIARKLIDQWKQGTL
jgi:NAD+ diphosphatase